MKKVALTAGLIAMASFAAPASAAVVVGEVTGGNSGGEFEEVEPGAGYTVGSNNQQSPNLFAFDEEQGAVLTADIAGITAGTLVDSHYVFFDPAGNSTVEGTITFDEEILAIITSSGDLFATDYLGNPVVNYISGGLRGLENGDTATFSGNTVTVSFRASSPGDYIRVLTRGEFTGAVPEPTTWAMLILGFLGIGGAMRRRNAKAFSKVAAVA